MVEIKEFEKLSSNEICSETKENDNSQKLFRPIFFFDFKH